MIVGYECDDEKLSDFYNLNYSPNNFKKFYDCYLQEKDNFAICFADIENFKTINYLYGYKYGDLLIDTVFNHIKICIGNDGHVCRFGGDVFLIILYKIKEKNQAKEVAERIEEVFNNPVRIQGKEIRITLKIGISLFPADCYDAESTLKSAEIAIKNAKKSYSHKFKFFSKHMHEEIVKKGKIEADILNAIHNQEFLLYFQPQVDINTMKVYGAEALLRWNHREYGVLPPAYFIDFIEQSTMDNQIGRMVLIEACRQLRQYINCGYTNLSISVNIAKRQLEEESSLGFIYHILEEAQVNPASLTIEITERSLVNPSEKVLNTLSALRSKGIKIYIDDFGKGYSCLGYLYYLPVDGIKIDKSFIDRVIESKRDSIVTKHIVELAQELNLEVVAEGVERDEQLQWLKSVGCNKIQGFIFSKPVETVEFIKFLNDFNINK